MADAATDRDRVLDADIRKRALARMGSRGNRLPRALRIGALAAMLALHGLALTLWYANRFVSHLPDASVVQIRLLDVPVPLPRPPEPANPHRAPAMTAAVLPAPASKPVIAPNAAAATGQQPLIFNRDGSIILPPDKPTPLEAGLARGRELLARGHNIIHCRRSKFDNSPTIAEAANNAARAAHMAHLVMGNPLDPLNDVGQQQQEEGASDLAARKREIARQACDWIY